MRAHVLEAWITCVQDLGRRGYRSQGVPVTGATDSLSARLANGLCGNPPGAPVLECAGGGLVLGIEGEGMLAIAGAPAVHRVNGVAVAADRPFWVRSGSEVRIGTPERGLRVYLAACGGWQVPAVLGSASTDLRGGFGGLQGRLLRSGDWLPAGELSAPAAVLLGRFLPQEWQEWQEGPLRALRGADARNFPTAARRTFWQGEYRAGSGDRMGIRLSGPVLAGGPGEILSAFLPTGAVQVPPSGQPVLILPDGGVTGGYPVLAVVAAVDRHRLGQIAPGEAVRFAPISPRRALFLWREREVRLSALFADWPQTGRIFQLRMGGREALVRVEEIPGGEEGASGQG